MSTEKRKKRYGPVLRIILLCLGLSFLLCLSAVCYISSEIKRDAAQQITQIVGPLFQKGLNREAVNILNGSRFENFHALTYLDAEGSSILKLPPTVPPSHFKSEQSLWTQLIYITESIPFYFEDNQSKQLKGTFIFSIKRFENISLTFFVWLILNMFTLPIFLSIYKMKRKEIRSAFALEAAKEQDEAIRQVRHDIKNPLSFLKAIAETTVGIDRKDQKSILKVIEEIRSYLDGLKNKKQSQYRSSTEKIYLSVFLSHFLERQKSRFYEKSINFKLELPTEFNDAFVKLNEAELTRVLDNLVLNSVEAIGEKTDGRVLISLKKDMDTVFIAIEDNGVGVEEKKLQEALKKGVSFKEGGSGLGLSYVQEKTLDWEGTFELNSTLGAGTKAQLTLPRVETPSWTGPLPAITENSEITLIDDDYNIHELFRLEAETTLPQSVPHKTIHPKNLSTLKPQDNQIFLVDYDFGESSCDYKNGLELMITKLRQYPKKLLFTQNYDDPNLVLQCQKMGITLLPKILLSSFLKNWYRLEIKKAPDIVPIVHSEASS